MNSPVDILHNSLIICAFLGWLSAQVIKTLLYLLYNRELRWERLVGSGGMPSSHSALVCALAAGAGIQYGFDGYQFALAALFAVVVMYDACGVRRAAGEHAKLLNELGELLLDHDKSPEEKLKEFIGHTPLQVLIGGILGVVIAILYL